MKSAKDGLKNLFSRMLASSAIVFIFVAFGLASASTAKLNEQNVDEIKRQWNYLDLLKIDNDRGIRKKSNRLLLAIENHLYANLVYFEVDPENSDSLLLKIMSAEELKSANQLNRFATSVFRKYRGLRVEIAPLKLKVAQAGALFDDTTNRLTLAYDNVLNLRTDTFVGHELIHARFYNASLAGRDHVYMGWVERNSSTPPLEDSTYPDSFSLDELVAYYYQVGALIAEAKRLPASLDTAKDFLAIGRKLSKHIVSDEISQFAENYLRDEHSKAVTFEKDKTYDIVKIQTQSYLLCLTFVLKEGRAQNELRSLAVARIAALRERSKLIFERFGVAEDFLKRSESKKAADALSSARDQVMRLD